MSLQKLSALFLIICTLALAACGGSSNDDASGSLDQVTVINGNA